MKMVSVWMVMAGYSAATTLTIIAMSFFLSRCNLSETKIVKGDEVIQEKTNIALVNIEGYAVGETGLVEGDSCKCKSNIWEKLGISVLEILVILFLLVGVTYLVVRGILKMRNMYMERTEKARILKTEKMAEMQRETLREVESAYCANAALQHQQQQQMLSLQEDEISEVKAITRKY